MKVQLFTVLLFIIVLSSVRSDEEVDAKIAACNKALEPFCSESDPVCKSVQGDFTNCLGLCFEKTSKSLSDKIDCLSYCKGSNASIGKHVDGEIQCIKVSNSNILTFFGMILSFLIILY